MADKTTRSADDHSLGPNIVNQSRGAVQGDPVEEGTRDTGKMAILGYCEMIEPLNNLHPSLGDLLYISRDQNGVTSRVGNGVTNGVSNGVGLQLDFTDVAVENESYFINYDSDIVLCDDSSSGKRFVRRCASLKTGKTPPGTPSRKKIVRFADALGLDLALVRTFLDDIPVVPQSAFDHLDATKEDAATFLRRRESPPSPLRSLIASFTQPATLPTFMETVKRQQVCLETATMYDEMTIRGVVRVLNVDFFKSVLVRFTTDEWITHTDVAAAYVTHSCDGFTDRFTFNLLASMLQPGQRLIFAVCYRVGGKEFWDSNNGTNYVFQCVSNSNLPDIALHLPMDTLPYI